MSTTVSLSSSGETNAVPAPAPTAPAPVSLVEFGVRRWLVVAGVMLAALMPLVDSTIVNVSLPTVEGNLGATLDEGTWIVTSYIIANVITIPLAPWLQLRFGRRAFFFVSVTGFALTSVFCGLANSFESEVVWRFVQGAFGGGILTLAQMTLRDTFPPERLSTGQGLFSLGTVLGPTLGPTLGGIMTDNVSWRWIFFVNVVPGVASALVIWFLLREPPRAKPGGMDYVGLGLLAAGLGALQYVLEEGERNDWFGDRTIVLCAALAVAAIVAFVLWELRGTPRPVVNLQVLSVRAIATAALLSGTFGFVLYGQFIISPPYLQNSLGFTTTMTGYYVLMRAGVIFALTPVVTRLLGNPKVPPRALVAAGLVILGYSFWMQADVMTSSTEIWTFFLSQAIGGVGFVMLFAPTAVAIFRAVPLKDAAAAIALTRLATQIGGSIASAVLITLVDRSMHAHYAGLAAAATAHAVAVRHYFEHGGTVASLYGQITDQAFVLGYADANRVIGAVCALSAPLTLFFSVAPRGKAQS